MHSETTRDRREFDPYDKSKRQWLGLSCVEMLMATIGMEEWSTLREVQERSGPCLARHPLIDGTHE